MAAVVGVLARKDRIFGHVLTMRTVIIGSATRATLAGKERLAPVNCTHRRTEIFLVEEYRVV